MRGVLLAAVEPAILSLAEVCGTQKRSVGLKATFADIQFVSDAWSGWRCVYCHPLASRQVCKLFRYNSLPVGSS